MDRKSEQTFFQRRHTDGQQVHEKMLNFANHQREMQIKTANAYLYLSKCPSPKILQITNAGEDVEKRES